MSPIWKSPEWRAAFLIWLLAAVFLSSAIGKNLTACPDCEKEVSVRAVSCPHCGCPGSFVAEVVRQKEEEKKPKSVVHIKADVAGGFGVAIEVEGARYVVLPVAAVGTADSLSLRTVQGDELPYSHLEVSKDASLIRFRVGSDALTYLRPSTALGDAPTSLLGETGMAVGVPTTPDSSRGVARLGSDGGVVALQVGGNAGDRWVALNQPIEWAAVEPSRFREQAALLARLASQPLSEPLAATDRTALENTDWICLDFRAHAQKLLKPVSSNPPKKP